MSEAHKVVVSPIFNKLVIQDTGATVSVDASIVKVISVGTQGPAGPNTIGGYGLPQGTPTDGQFIVFDDTNDIFVYTNTLDSGTFGG